MQLGKYYKSTHRSLNLDCESNLIFYKEPTCGTIYKKHNNNRNLFGKYQQQWMEWL